MGTILDFSTANAQITDEIINVSDSNPVTLEHDIFYNKTGKLVVISTGAGGTGTVLTDVTDYTIGGSISDSFFPTSIAPDIGYTTIAITNATYHSTDLYVSYYPISDVFRAGRWNSSMARYDVVSGTATVDDNLHVVGDITSDSDVSTTSQTSLDNSWTGEIEYRVTTGILYINFLDLDGSGRSSSTVWTLPSGSRPAETFYVSALGVSGTDTPVIFEVRDTGVIVCQNDTTGLDNTAIRGSGSWPIA